MLAGTQEKLEFWLDALRATKDAHIELRQVYENFIYLYTN
jgi:hypothetical protein